MTDAELGAAIRRLASLPVDSGMRVTVYCDEGEMAFGSGHRINAGCCRRGHGETLDDQIRDLLAQWPDVEAYIARRSKP